MDFVRARQAEDNAAGTALDTLDAASAEAAAGAVAAKLGAAGFGTRTSPSLGDVMARLKAKAGLPAAAQTL